MSNLAQAGACLLPLCVLQIQQVSNAQDGGSAPGHSGNTGLQAAGVSGPLLSQLSLPKPWQMLHPGAIWQPKVGNEHMPKPHHRLFVTRALLGQ